jgi:hypothetical protein
MWNILPWVCNESPSIGHLHDWECLRVAHRIGGDDAVVMQQPGNYGIHFVGHQGLPGG